MRFAGIWPRSGLSRRRGSRTLGNSRLIEMEEDETIPACVRMALAPLVRQLHALDQEIACSDRTIAAMARDQETARRLMTIPGLGPVTASAMAASVQDFLGPARVRRLSWADAETD